MTDGAATCRVGLDEGVDGPDDAGLVVAMAVGVRAGDLEVGRRDVGERQAAAAVGRRLLRLAAHAVVLCKEGTSLILNIQHTTCVFWEGS